MKYRIEANGIYQFWLRLNPMMSNAESGQSFGPFETKEEAIKFYENEKCEPYKDQGPDMFGPGKKTYHKSFKKDGPLEWLNPLHESEFDAPGYFGHGIHEVLSHVEDVRVLHQIG